MQEILTAQKIPNLAGLGNVVPEGYSYYKKHKTIKEKYYAITNK